MKVVLRKRQLKNCSKDLFHFYLSLSQPFLARVVLKMVVNIPSVLLWSLFLEAAKLSLFTKNCVYLFQLVWRLPEGIIHGFCLVLPNSEFTQGGKAVGIPGKQCKSGSNLQPFEEIVYV